MSARSYVDSDQESLYEQYVVNNINSPEENASNGQRAPRNSPRKRKLTQDPVPSPSFNTIKKAAISTSGSQLSAAEHDQYAENFRQLIVTARRQIKELQQKNEELQKRVDSGCVLRCPGCFLTFNDNDHAVLPKYMRIFRPRCTIEMEFHSPDELDEYVTANRISLDENGVPVQIPVRKRMETLQEVGSSLPWLVEKQKLSQSTGKVRIAIRKDATPQRERNRPPPATLVIAEVLDVDSGSITAPRSNHHPPKVGQRQGEREQKKPEESQPTVRPQEVVKEPLRQDKTQEKQRFATDPQRHGRTEKGPPRQEKPQREVKKEPQRNNKRAVSQEEQRPVAVTQESQPHDMTGPQPVVETRPQRPSEVLGEPHRRNKATPPQEQQRPATVTEKPQHQSRPQEPQRPVFDEPQRYNKTTPPQEGIKVPQRYFKKGPQEQQRAVLENGPQRHDKPQEQQRTSTAADGPHRLPTATDEPERSGTAAPTVPIAPAPERQGTSSEKRLPAARKLECVEGRKSVFDRISKVPASGSSANIATPTPPAPVEERKEDIRSTLTTAEWRNAMAGVFSNPSGVVGLEVPSGCVAPKKAETPATDERKVPPLILRRRSPRRSPKTPPIQPQMEVIEEGVAPPKAPPKQATPIAKEATPPPKQAPLPPKEATPPPKEATPPPKQAAFSQKTTPRAERYRNRTAQKESEERKERDGHSGSRERERKAREDRRRNSRDREPQRARTREDRSQRVASRPSRKLDRRRDTFLEPRDARQIADEYQQRNGGDRRKSEEERVRREEERPKGGRSASRGGLRSREEDERRRKYDSDSRPVDPNRRSSRQAAALLANPQTFPNRRNPSIKRSLAEETSGSTPKRRRREASKSPRKAAVTSRGGKSHPEVEDGEIRSDEEADFTTPATHVDTTKPQNPPAQKGFVDEGAESDTIDVYEDMVPIETLRKAAALPPLQEEASRKEMERSFEVSPDKQDEEEEKEEVPPSLEQLKEKDERSSESREKETKEGGEDAVSEQMEEMIIGEEYEMREEQGLMDDDFETTVVPQDADQEQMKEAEEEEEDSISGDLSIDEGGNEDDLASQLAMSDSEEEEGEESGEEEEENEVESSSGGEEGSEGPTRFAPQLPASTDSREADDAADELEEVSSGDEVSERPSAVAPQLTDSAESQEVEDEASEGPSTSGSLDSSNEKEGEEDEVSGSVGFASNEEEEAEDEEEVVEDEEEVVEDEEEDDSGDEKQRNKQVSPQREDSGSTGGDDDFGEWGQIVYNDEDVLSDSFCPDDDDDD